MAQKGHPWEAMWDVGERLGKGGQGLTNLASRKTNPSEQAAIKVLKNNKDLQSRGRMHREVASLEVLSTAGGAVPHVLDHNTQDYLDKTIELFVVMQYIPGHTLREVIDTEGVLSLQYATEITLRLCETVELAHTFPVLHRDLKPDNIIARDVASADIVIVDYGLSFNADDSDVTATEETFRNRFLDLPETNTPGGNRRDPRSDVTAVCAIYYYLLTGHSPGQLQSADGRLPHVRPGYSLREAIGESGRIGQLEILFNRGFALNVDNRFQTVAEFRDRIRLMTKDVSSAKPENPVAVAQRASAVLRQHDRTTQINEFRKPAQDILQNLTKFTNGYSNKLERFQLTAVIKSRGSGTTFSNNLDLVTPQQLELQLNPAHHNHLRIAAYTIASRGEQCVILRQMFTREGKNNSTKPVGDHEELLWYDASSKPDLTPVHSDIQAWLNTAIQELTDIVVAQ